MALLAQPVQALARAPAWALNYTRTACDTAETLWLLDRRDHLRSVEAAVRLKALPADFRFPMMDLRLSLARLCAVDGRPDEAAHWFGQARAALEEQGARPLRAITDFDEALMYARLERHASARPLLEAAVGQFAADRDEPGGCDGPEQVAATCSSPGGSGRDCGRPRPGRDRTETAAMHAGLSGRESIMKAIRVHAYGQPPRLDHVPEPEATGRRTWSSGLAAPGCAAPTCTSSTAGSQISSRPTCRVILGHENAGWVHAVGPAVEHLAVGDPVICHPNLTCGVCRACRAGDDMRCAQGPQLARPDVPRRHGRVVQDQRARRHQAAC